MRPRSAADQLASFPGVVATVLGTLVDAVRVSSRDLSRCARAVGVQAMQLPAYLTASDRLITDSAARLDSVTKIFFSELDTLMTSAQQMLTSVTLLKQGKTVIDALSDAAGVFTRSNYQVRPAALPPPRVHTPSLWLHIGEPRHSPLWKPLTNHRVAACASARRSARRPRRSTATLSTSPTSSSLPSSKARSYSCGASSRPL